MTKQMFPSVRLLRDGDDWLAYAGDLLIARCQAGVWISLEAGWVVKPNASYSKVSITHNGVTMDYAMPKRQREVMMRTVIEQPTIGPDGEPRWQPHGARQRYADRMSEEVDPGRLFMAAAHVLFNRKLKAGKIGPHDEITPTQEEVLNVIAWSDLRQLRLLKEMAEGLIVEREAIH